MSSFNQWNSNGCFKRSTDINRIVSTIQPQSFCLQDTKPQANPPVKLPLMAVCLTYLQSSHTSKDFKTIIHDLYYSMEYKRILQKIC